MFKFANPEYLYLLFLIPFFIVILIVTTYKMHQNIKKYGNAQTLDRLAPNRSRIRPILKYIITIIIIALVVVLLSRPQFGSTPTTKKVSGIEIVIAMDVSNSMLATDISPNRLERSKLLVSTILNKLNEDKIAIIAFAGEAYPQLPITNDLTSAKLFLESITTDIISSQGTNLAAAINLASKSFSENKEVGKVIVLITDGENHEEGAIEAAETIAKDGKKLYVLGIGSDQGSTIPTSSGPLFDSNGKVVISKLNPEMCKKVASAGKGTYFHVDNTNLAQDNLLNELDKLQKTDSYIKTYSDFDEQFQAIGLLILLLLVLEFFLLETQNPILKKIKLFK